MVYEISQPKRGPCENGHWLRNDFAAQRSPLRNQGLAAKTPFRCEMLCEIPKALRIPFSQPQPHFAAGFVAAKHLLGTRVPFHNLQPHFALRNALRNPQSFKNPNFAAIAPFRRWFRSCETIPWHMSAISQPSTLILQLQNGLRNWPSTAKIPTVPWHPFLNVINSTFHFKLVI